MAPRILPANLEAYKRAADILTSGGLVALPTETVYGLAADARNDAAVSHIYEVKGRPAHNPLIAHVLNPNDAKTFADISPLAHRLIEAFWPGPLTLVLPRKGRALSSVANANLPTLALRCPDVAWVAAFKTLGVSGPLFMPSANLSGHVSPTTAQHVYDDFGDKIDLIIDGGRCQGGLESTVLQIDGAQATLLRPGGLTHEDFAPYVAMHQQFANTVDTLSPDTPLPAAPGMLASHYAPKAKVRLNATDKRAHETYLTFGPLQDGAGIEAGIRAGIRADYNLSPSGDLREAARNLYDALRRLDTEPTIAVAPIPATGIGLAINDRLRRAASER